MYFIFASKSIICPHTGRAHQENISCQVSLLSEACYPCTVAFLLRKAQHFSAAWRISNGICIRNVQHSGKTLRFSWWKRDSGYRLLERQGCRRFRVRVDNVWDINVHVNRTLFIYNPIYKYIYISDKVRFTCITDIVRLTRKPDSPVYAYNRFRI
jgi:hypothetical protein